MNKFLTIPMIAALSLGLAACGKPTETTNETTIETNTVVEDTDANLSATDGVDTANSSDLLNTEESNASTNAL